MSKSAQKSATCETKSFQLLGALPPDLLTRGSAHGPRWGQKKLGVCRIDTDSPGKMAIKTSVCTVCVCLHIVAVWNKLNQRVTDAAVTEMAHPSMCLC